MLKTILIVLVVWIVVGLILFFRSIATSPYMDDDDEQNNKIWLNKNKS